MDRMKSWQLPLYAVAGFLAIIIATPASRWIVQTQIDVLAGRWHYMGGSIDVGSGPWVKPEKRGIEGQNKPSQNETARFLQLIALSHNNSDPSAYGEDFREFYLKCRTKSDTRYWALFVRAASMQAMVPPTDTKTFTQVDHRLVQEMLRDACTAASKLDPSNAYFKLILAGTLYRLGEVTTSRLAFLDAGKCNRFDEYVSFEPDLTYSYLLDKFGYRGERLHTWILFDTWFPDITVIQSLCRHFSVEQDLPARSTTAKIANLMMSQGRTVIESLVGRNLLNVALAPSRKTAIYKELSVEELSKDSQNLQRAEPTTGDLTKAVRLYEKITNGFSHFHPSLVDNSMVLNLRPAFSAGSLLGLLVLPCALGFIWIRLRFPRFAAASPYLIWLLAYLSDPIFGPWAAIGTGFGTAWLLFFPALALGIRKYVDILGVAIAALALIMSCWTFPLVLPSLMFLCCLVLERKISAVKTEFTVPSVIIACVLTSGCWVEMATRISWGDGVLFGIIAGIGLFSAIPVKLPIRWTQLAGIACGVLGLWFGTMVYLELADDQQIAVINRELLNDADQLR